MQRLNTFLLLLFLCFATGLTAQDETSTFIQRAYYSADQIDRAVKADAALLDLYRQNGATTPFTAWVFDDNTVEYVWEVKSFGELDLLQAEYDAAAARIGRDRIEEMEVPMLKSDFWYGREVKAYSYEPEGFDASDVGYIRVIRGRLKKNDQEELKRVATEIVELSKKQGRQTPFSFEVFPLGLGSNTFEVVEYARDRADFERREAASKKSQYDTKAYKAWAKKRDALIEVIGERTAVKNEAASIAKPKSTDKPSRYLLINELAITDRNAEGVLDFWETWKELSTTYHYPETAFIATTLDNKTMMRLSWFDNYAEIDRQIASGKQMAYAPQEAKEKMRAAVEGLFSASNEYLLRSRPEYQYVPDGYELQKDRPSTWTMTVYEYPFGKEKEAGELMKAVKDAYVAANSSILYQVFTPAIGGAPNRFIVVTFGDDRADQLKRISEGNAALPEATRQNLQERMDKLMTIERRVSGITHLDKRYDPKSARK